MPSVMTDIEEREVLTPPKNESTVQPLGCILEDYAAAKKIPVEFLKQMNLSQFTYQERPAVRIPYCDSSGVERAVRFRTRLEKAEGGEDNRFRWKSGAKPFLYGVWRLDGKQSHVVLVEGESDCHTLWHHGINALGLPGVGNWRDERDAGHLDRFETIYVLIEPGDSGEGMLRWLGKSSIRGRARLVRLKQFKDPNDLHVADPDRFLVRWQAAIEASIPWAEQAAAVAIEERKAAWAQCADLAQAPDILDRFARIIHEVGVVGEERTARLLYLILTSRILKRVVSAAVKGVSSGGKSYLVQSVLNCFPDDAYYTLTAMSEHALAYSDEPLQHRFLVLIEADGMSGDFASYLIRSLLSEGRIRYETVEKGPGGLKPRLIEREGPTGLLVTTTKTGLHPENETRLLSLTITDSQAQTKEVLLGLATEGPEVDLGNWRALQKWLQTGDNQVSIPYSVALAKAIPPVAVRLRRDFTTLLNLIKTHAILHQVTRQRDVQGKIIATLHDYAVVRDLISDLMSEGVEATVEPTVRETVDAVHDLLSRYQDGVTIKAVGDHLDLDKSAAFRRCKKAIARGYLQNEEDRKGKPARLKIGDQMPEDLMILPKPEVLTAVEKGNGCTVDPFSEGNSTPLSGSVGHATEMVMEWFDGELLSGETGEP